MVQDWSGPLDEPFGKICSFFVIFVLQFVPQMKFVGAKMKVVCVDLVRECWWNTESRGCFADRQGWKFGDHLLELDFGGFAFWARHFPLWRHVSDWTRFFKIRDDVLYCRMAWGVAVLVFSISGIDNLGHTPELIVHGNQKHALRRIVFHFNTDYVFQQIFFALNNLLNSL